MILRLAITVCLLLFGSVVSSAQKKVPDPLDLVVTELQAGRTQEALAALDEVIKQNPKHADAYLLRGSLRMSDDIAQSLSDFTKVIELKPDSGTAYNQRAIIRLLNNDMAAAVKDLDAAIAHNVDDDSVYYLRGQLRSQLGDLKGALSDLNEAIKRNPGNPNTYLTRANVLADLNELDRALADLNYLINWYETDPSARPLPKPAAAAANSQSKSQTKDDAKPFKVEIAQQTANQAPGDKEMSPVIAGAYNRRGFILSARGNRDAAFSDFGKAIGIDPKSVWPFYNRANEYEYKGDLAAALVDIKQAIQLEPTNGNLIIEHGVILLLMGKDKEAQVVFDVLLQSDRALWQKRIDDRTAAVRKIVPPR